MKKPVVRRTQLTYREYVSWVNPICIAKEDYNLLPLTPKNLFNPEHCFFIRPSLIIYTILNFSEILPPLLSHMYL